MVRSGLRVLDAMLEEDRTALCGPRYAHQPERPASRAGKVPSEVVLGGRKVAVQRPRVRADGREVPLPTFQALAHTDPLNRRVVDQMLVGVATRQYARSLEPVPADVVSRGTSKSSVSRRFVAKTTAQLRAWQAAPLDGLDLVALILDGVHIGEHCLVVALGIAADGQKHALGLWEGATENTAVCQSLLANLQSRGLRTDRSLLVILDGAPALHKATRTVFGAAALIQRCQVHKLRNILDHLPERQRPWVQAIVRRAYQATEMKTATRLLTDLAKRLEDEVDHAMFTTFAKRLAAKKIHCEEFDGGDGNAGSISVQRGDSDEEPTIYRMLLNRNHAVSVRFVTMAHELGHLLLGHLGADKALSVPRRQPLTHAEQELEAESVAYIVAQRNGVKSKSQTYLASFVKRETTIDDLDVFQVMRDSAASSLLIRSTST